MHTKSHPISSEGGNGLHQLTSFHYGAPGAGKKVYIQGGLHADEVPGMLVAHAMRRHLDLLEAAGRIRGEIVVVPAANPIGLAQAIHGIPFGRFDLSTGINFNRQFRHVANDIATALEQQLGPDPQENVALIRASARAAVAGWQPVTDAEAMKKALLSMAIDADIVLDLHCDNEAMIHMYTGTPLTQAAAPLAALVGAHAFLVAREAGDEPFDEACSRLWWDLDERFEGRFPIPPACLAATIELRGEMDVNHAFAERDAQRLIQFLAHQGIVDAAPLPLPMPLCQPTPLEGVAPMVAPHAGIVVFLKDLGDIVQQGEALADLIDPVSGNTTTMRASVPGVFFARTAHRHLLRGMAVGKIAGPAAFRAGKLLSQ